MKTDHDESHLVRIHLVMKCMIMALGQDNCYVDVADAWG